MKMTTAGIACALFLCATSALAQSGPLAEFQINGTKTPLTYSETVLDEHAVSIVAKIGDRVVK